jgi:hypothetical protein
MSTTTTDTTDTTAALANDARWHLDSLARAATQAQRLTDEQLVNAYVQIQETHDAVFAILRDSRT